MNQEGSNVFLINPLCRAAYTYGTLYKYIAQHFRAEIIEPLDYLGENFTQTSINITNAISKHSGLSYPVYVIGFSASGLLATTVAEDLLKHGYNSKLILIDTFPMMNDFLTSMTNDDVAYRLYYNIYRSNNLEAPLNEIEFKEKLAKSEISELDEKELKMSFELLSQFKSKITNTIKVSTFVLLAKDGVERYPKFIANVNNYFSTSPTIKLYSYYHLELIFADELCIDILRYISATQSC